MRKTHPLCTRTRGYDAADVNAQSNFQQTPLGLASLEGHLDVVQVLLEHGADVNLRGEEGLTALHDAISNQHFEVMELLLKYMGITSMSSHPSLEVSHRH